MRSILFAMAMLATPLAAPAQVLSDYAYGSDVLLPDSLREVSLGGRLELTVTRQVADSVHRTLIEAAERLYPTGGTIHEAILAALSEDSTEHLRLKLEEAARIEGAPRWWWYDTPFFRVPFALTGSAVAYNLARAREVVHIPVQPHTRASPRRVYMEYYAQIEQRGDDPEAPVAVRLLLRVGQFCGGLCGGGFEARRLVLFDQDGHPVRVTGDGEFRFWES